eukprot:gene10803-2445_t
MKVKGETFLGIIDRSGYSLKDLSKSVSVGTRKMDSWNFYSFIRRQRVGGRGGGDEALGVSLGRTASGADLGGNRVNIPEPGRGYGGNATELGDTGLALRVWSVGHFSDLWHCAADYWTPQGDWRTSARSLKEGLCVVLWTLRQALKHQLRTGTDKGNPTV